MKLPFFRNCGFMMKIVLTNYISRNNQCCGMVFASYNHLQLVGCSITSQVERERERFERAHVGCVQVHFAGQPLTAKFDNHIDAVYRRHARRIFIRRKARRTLDYDASVESTYDGFATADASRRLLSDYCSAQYVQDNLSEDSLNNLVSIQCSVFPPCTPHSSALVLSSVFLFELVLN